MNIKAIKKEKFDFVPLILIFLSLVISISSYLLLLHNNLIMVFGDSKGHLDIARRVIDSPTSGLAQLGGYWLPIFHLIILLTVWNNFFWHTGLAGSIPNMIMFVALVFFVYKFAFNLTKDRYIAVLSSIIVVFNPNALVLQATPMTEITFTFLFFLGGYLFYKWSINQNNILYLIGSAFFIFSCSLTRYEGWAAVAFGSFIILLQWLFFNAKNRGKNESAFIVYSVLAWLGIILWVLWDAIVLKNPLDFIQNEQSAKTQVKLFYSVVKATGQGNIGMAALTNIYSLAHIAGIVGVIILFSGLIYLFIKEKLNFFSVRTTSILLLLSPFLFDILSVYLGNVPVEVPELSKSIAPGNLFNVRYSIFALPAIAIFAAIISNKKRLISTILIVAILINYFILITPNWKNIATLKEASASGQSKNDLDRINWFKRNYTNGLILASTGAADGFMFDIGISLNHFIVEGSYQIWDQSLVNPEKYATWIIYDSGNKRDSVSHHINTYKLSHFFYVVYQQGTYKIYKRKLNKIIE